MRRSDLPKYATTFVENKVTGQIASVVHQLSYNQAQALYGYGGRQKARGKAVLKDKETGELYLADLKDLVYEPYLEYPEINWSEPYRTEHAIRWGDGEDITLWIAFPETTKWLRSARGYGKISDFVHWLEETYQRDEHGESILGSRTGASRIYYTTVSIDRLPGSLEEFKAAVESKIAELI